MDKELDDLQRARIIEEGLAGEFWRKILLPLLTLRKKALEAALRDPDVARKYKMPDDYIRGGLALAELLLDQPALLAETIRNAEIEEVLEKQRQYQYDLVAHNGLGSLADEE